MTALHRVQAFERLLVEWYTMMRARAFAWGTCDCWTVARDGARVLAGDPTFGEGVASYTTLDEARASYSTIVLEYGSFAAWLDQFGWHDVGGIGHARPGDVLMWPALEPLPHFAIVIGRDVVECLTDHGVICTPLAARLSDQTARTLRLPA